MRDRTIHTVSTFLSTNICYYKEQNNNLMVETGQTLSHHRDEPTPIAGVTGGRTPAWGFFQTSSLNLIMTRANHTRDILQNNWSIFLKNIYVIKDKERPNN